MRIDQIATKTGKYSLLLICLLIALILFPVLENYKIGHVCLTLWCLISLVAVALTLQDNKRVFRNILVTGGILFALIVATLFSQLFKWETQLIYHFSLPAATVFFAYIAWIILLSIFKQKKLSADQLSGAIVAYLLIGIIWALLYSYIELLCPNSFSFVSADDLQAKGSALFYYSFVTLTTLGYGDILPISQFARMVAYLEAVTGVMYTAILVAGLVGHIGNKTHTTD